MYELHFHFITLHTRKGKGSLRDAWLPFIVSRFLISYLFNNFSLILRAAFLPSPMARITVAPPRTISPPA